MNNFLVSENSSCRHYDPSVGRFLQQDPDPGKVMNPITVVNKYAYTGNNPVMFTDPCGKFFGWDDLIVYALISSLITTTAQYYIGQLKWSETKETFLKNFIITFTTLLVGDIFFGYTNMETLNSMNYNIFLNSSYEYAKTSFMYQGLLDITNNAVGTNITPFLAITTLIFYPEVASKVDLKGNLFVIPK